MGTILNSTFEICDINLRNSFIVLIEKRAKKKKYPSADSHGPIHKSVMIVRSVHIHLI
jgi:hypothetical protein